MIERFLIAMHRLLITFTLVVSMTASQSAGEDAKVKFYRAINLNGPAIVIDGQSWESDEAQNLQVDGMAFENESVPLRPMTDSSRAKMIHSSRWGRTLSIELLGVPEGVYQVFAYVWEDNDPEEYSIQLNGRTVVARHNSGTRGQWKRLGPWKTNAKDGRLKLAANGGAANFSGIEVWSGTGQVPDPSVAEFASSSQPRSSLISSSPASDRCLSTIVTIVIARMRTKSAVVFCWIRVLG